jgi:Tol biopolymer transport system component
MAILLGTAGLWIYKRRETPAAPVQRTLTRLTFDDGLQVGATWSPDGRYLAYASDRGGKFDIWVQQLSGGDPIQITKGPGQNWQPDWSPDGKYIAYRSEEGEGGLYIVPALGGTQRKIAAFGYYPHWSPDSSQVLFQPVSFPGFKSLHVFDLSAGAPHQVLKDFFAKHMYLVGRWAAWHPDGKRISVLGGEPSHALTIWTVPLTEGSPIASVIDPKLFDDLGGPAFTNQIAVSFKFSWSPLGNSVFLEHGKGGANNLWRLSLDPNTLQIDSAVPLTTGAGSDTECAVSPNGKELAFTVETRYSRVWLSPFHARSGKITGEGKLVTSPGFDVGAMDLSHDDSRLAFSASRGSSWNVWVKALDTGDEVAVQAEDSYTRGYPVWSQDGTRLAYRRMKPDGKENGIILWSRQRREEEVIGNEDLTVFDWSADGKTLLVSKWNNDLNRAEIWTWPVATAAGEAPVKIAADPTYFLFQPRFSSDGQWITFEAVHDGSNERESTIYVVPRKGGAWIPITDSKQWDDKPRWSPDGQRIYFISRRGGFNNVWGRRFDQANRAAVGDPFQVTAFVSPALMPPTFVPEVQLSVSPRHLAVNVTQVSGGIWTLNNVSR